MNYGCSMCGKTVRRRRWVALNRYIVSDGRNRTPFEGRRNDEYAWTPEDSAGTGAMLHYPECLLTWLEGKMVEVDYRAKHPE